MTYVYYAERDGLIKIGYSRNPSNRMSSLPGAELRAVEPGDRSLEQERHAQFHASRVTGEWFSPTEDLRNHMAALKDEPPKASTIIRIKGDVYNQLQRVKHSLELSTGRSVSMSEAVDYLLKKATR